MRASPSRAQIFAFSAQSQHSDKQTPTYASSGIDSMTAASVSDADTASLAKNPPSPCPGRIGHSQSPKSVSGNPTSVGKSTAAHPQNSYPKPSPGRPLPLPLSLLLLLLLP